MVLIFINFNLSVFPFMYHAFDVISKKALPDPRSQRFSPLFSPRSYIILGFMFSSIIYFKLSFYMMYSMNWSSLFFLHRDIQLYHLLKRTICLLNFLCNTVKNQLSFYLRISFWTLSLVPLILLTNMPIWHWHCVDCFSLTSLETR